VGTQIRNNAPIFLSVSDAPLRLGVTAPTLRRWIHEGRVRASRPGGDLRSLRIPVFEIGRLERS
jgi:excisionase family DNA binding protein